jgi:hypothetical protein
LQLRDLIAKLLCHSFTLIKLSLLLLQVHALTRFERLDLRRHFLDARFRFAATSFAFGLCIDCLIAGSLQTDAQPLVFLALSLFTTFDLFLLARELFDLTVQRFELLAHPLNRLRCGLSLLVRLLQLPRRLLKSPPVLELLAAKFGLATVEIFLPTLSFFS